MEKSPTFKTAKIWSDDDTVAIPVVATVRVMLYRTTVPIIYENVIVKRNKMYTVFLAKCSMESL